LVASGAAAFTRPDEAAEDSPKEGRKDLKSIGFRQGDLLIGISTSGNAKNVLRAAELARAMGVRVLSLTGAGGGALSEVATVAVRAPEKETFLIQELHLPIYHCLCAEVERRIFG
jgi:D-sedoheptulose 7-phosphate isomerase